MQRFSVLRAIARHSKARSMHTTSTFQSAWSASPSPPRLPREEQELFEKLQKQSTGAFSTPSSSDSSTSSPTFADLRARINQSPDTASASTDAVESDSAGDSETERAPLRVQASGKGEELHPHIRVGARPEFEGERNPKTGEVGGPKNEPLRWGGSADWSYNGRVTDF